MQKVGTYLERQLYGLTLPVDDETVLDQDQRASCHASSKEKTPQVSQRVLMSPHDMA